MTNSETPAILPGCEPMSHAGGGAHGALVLHGFTGNPSSMRGVADAFAAAGYHVELPRLPGHGTSVDDMLATRWDDWTGEVEAAYERLAGRAEQVVVAGLSMGGALTLWTGTQHLDVAGLICVNPLTQIPAPEIVEMVDEMIESGTETMPAVGGDIADPDAVEIAYDATPLRPLQSLLGAVGKLTEQLPSMKIPVRLFTSRQDHVVEPSNSEFLVETYGGEVEHTWLDRSYHVATQDYDRELIFTEAVAFADRVTQR